MFLLTFYYGGLINVKGLIVSVDFFIRLLPSLYWGRYDVSLYLFHLTDGLSLPLDFIVSLQDVFSVS